MTTKDKAWPKTIREINRLPEEEKYAIYKTLLPDWLFTSYGVDSGTPQATLENQPIIQFRCPRGTRAMELIVKQRATDLDPLLYINLADAFNNQLIVLLVVVNDPDSPRYNVDIDLQGNPTHFGTTSRNKPAEIAAMRAGLSPGQIRRGLRAFKESVPLFEDFVRRLGHDIFFIEPLAYHNAIVFESYGFSYLRGHQDMVWINEAFQPDGELHKKLNDDNPFRHKDAWRTVRGRSWAIHDGILGHPFTGFQMYKRVGGHAGINTFPDAEW
ncbi:MAG: hypothetical protein EA396_14055 [Anaerolineaceae bacterium]|nr:MAG: hypothetical protein EA396_14055 [Anaerolineaceae bacterium]